MFRPPAVDTILTKEDWGGFVRYDDSTRTCLGELTGGLFIEEALKWAPATPPSRTSP